MNAKENRSSKRLMKLNFALSYKFEETSLETSRFRQHQGGRYAPSRISKMAHVPIILFTPYLIDGFLSGFFPQSESVQIMNLLYIS